MLNKRTLKDLALSVTKALPAANASNASDAIDTASENPGRTATVNPGVHPELLVELPATPALVEDKTITLTVEDSADGENFAAVADLPAIVVTGAAAAAGGAAVERRFALPINLRRHVRLAQAVLTGGGDNTAVSGKLSFVF